MKHTMTKSALAMYLSVFTLVAFFAVGPALAQRLTQPSMRIEIPFKFTVGSKTLPAGIYTFSENPYGLTVQAEAGGAITQLIITRITGPAEFLRNGSVVFDKTGGDRIVSEVWIPGSDGLLLHSVPKKDLRNVILADYLPQNGTVTGAEAYNQTCGRCHGPEGTGNEQADKFFKTRIPRLNSNLVQNLTNEQLRKQVSQGSDLMPPVEVDEGGFRHRLPPQDVDAVIAYVRTFKRAD